ncbi:MAG: metallophosphoesterase [Desulfobulbaceae bacterium]|nr:metallophosphoesterase [Desulfobulbaceae bacterium]
MSLFLIIFFLIYGSFHLYALLKARTAFRIRGLSLIGAALFVLVMVPAPLLVRISERKGYETLAGIIAGVGYTWMGWLFLLVSTLVFLDLVRLLIITTNFLISRQRHVRLPAREAFVIALALASAAAGYGWFEARDIRTRKIVIETEKLPPDLPQFKIALISDVHLGLQMREKQLARILLAVKEAEPDLLVSAGDLVDGQIDGLSGLSGLFQKINPPFGKYAVTGNHEYYAGISESLDFMKKAGFTVLRGETVSIGRVISLSGVDDSTAERFGNARMVSEEELLSRMTDEKFSVLLKHKPEVNQDSQKNFDLQLSGHTHNGQLFPFILFTRIKFPFPTGTLHQLPQGLLYVSPGAGTWGPPIRFLAPPEVTVIELVHVDAT